DPVAGEPVVEHRQRTVRRPPTAGTRVALPWPGLPDQLLSATLDDCWRSTDADESWADAYIAGGLRDAGTLVRSFALFNPHAGFTLERPGEPALAITARKPGCSKWKPGAKIPPHWYTSDTFAALVASLVRIDRRAGGKTRSVREFLTDFKGLSDTQR